MDGLRLECKDASKAHRISKRSKYNDKYNKQVEDSEHDDDSSHMAVFKKYSSEITRKHFYMFIDFLKHKKVKFIIAPYEADSQLAYMYHTESIQYILTEDSDLVAYGCLNIIKGLKKNGDCSVLNPDKKLKTASATLKSFFKLDPESRTKCCILAGCDYLPNIKGLGLATLTKMFGNRTEILEQVIEYAVRTKKLYTMTTFGAFRESFYNAILAFTEQLVYCPIKERIVNLSAYQYAKKPALKPLDHRFVGRPIPNEREFVAGKIDFDDLSRKRKVKKMDFDRILKFFEFRPDFSTGRIGNLTTQLFTYDNFDKPEEVGDSETSEAERLFIKRNNTDSTVYSIFGCKKSETETMVSPVERSPARESFDSLKRTKI